MPGKTKTGVHAKPDYTLHRHEVGGPVAPDSANLDTLYMITAIKTGASGPLDTEASPRRDLMDCEGWETVQVYVRLAGGAAPTVTLQPLEQIVSNDSDGVAVDELGIAAANTPAIGDRGSAEVTINGGKLFLRLHAVTGNPTAVDIYVAGAKRLSMAHGSRRAI